SVVMFCDFYRAQAWYWWMRSNGSAKSSLKFLLQQVTHAASYPDFIERCNALNESPDYSEKARDWFMKHWLSHQQQYLDHPVFKLDEEVLTMKTFLGYRKVYFSGFLQKNRTLNLQVKPKEKPKLKSRDIFALCSIDLFY
ncbi:hypothetical protein CAPTEDRAFT_213942, partial [Capitella teleta]